MNTLPDESKEIAGSVYVHVPFCAHRCGYCNFALIANRHDLVESFLQAIQLEVEALSEIQSIETMFWGGGTPSQLSPQQIQKLFDIVVAKFKFANNYEFSVEINPNDLDQERANVFRDIGVNRASFGVQSFQQDKLDFLERSHSVQQIHSATNQSREFANSVSFDLIFGLAGETARQWQRDLEAAIELRPDHLSTYALTIEKGTQFWNRQFHGNAVSVDEDQSAELYELTIDCMQRSGFNQYEISSFARPTHECRHNQVYWSGLPYLAFGPGAASFDGVTRRRNHQSVTTYIKRMLNGDSPVAQYESLDKESLNRERLIFGLRQTCGVEVEAFKSKTGCLPEQLIGANRYELFLKQKLLCESNGFLKLTRKGMLLSDSIFVELI